MQLRERSVREYEGTVQGMLEWQGSSSSNAEQPRYYLPGAPTHFPVVVQRQWDTLHTSSSSSSGRTSGSQGDDSSESTASPSSHPPAAAASVRQLSAEEQATLAGIDAVMQQQLGCALPARAYRGERSLLLASLSPQAIKDRVSRWVGCCGREFVVQLMTKEPMLLGHEPQVLLSTLEAVSSEMKLSPQVRRMDGYIHSRRLLLLWLGGWLGMWVLVGAWLGEWLGGWMGGCFVA